MAREYGQETSPNPLDHQRVDRDLDYDGCVTTSRGLSRIGASLQFVDAYPDQLPPERTVCDVIPTFVAAVDLDARSHLDPVAQSLRKDAPKKQREDQWTRPWLNVIVFDPSKEMRAHFERCLLWAAINRARYVGYKVWNSSAVKAGSSRSITEIAESSGSKRVYFEGFCFWPTITFQAAHDFPWPSGFDDL